MEPLDNPTWHALTGPQARFRQGGPHALRYEPEVAAFSALPDRPDPRAWDELGALASPGGAAVLLRTDPLELPTGWTAPMRLATLQMVATEPLGEPDSQLTELGTRDAPEMLDLALRTRPGPFSARTHELGSYFGLREDGRLVAMAGERMRLDGFTEISAVCTDEQARKRGLATRLVRTVAAGIEARGDTPILHVLADNANAIRVYERLGFAVRAAFDVLVVQAPS